MEFLYIHRLKVKLESLFSKYRVFINYLVVEMDPKINLQVSQNIAKSKSINPFSVRFVGQSRVVNYLLNSSKVFFKWVMGAL